jgi:DNA-binding transcriptional MerR regulator
MSDVYEIENSTGFGINLINQVRMVYPSQLDALVIDFTTALGVCRKLQDIVERNYEFFHCLRNNGLELREIANLLTELGFQSEAGGAVKPKSVQSALARAAKRARNYSASNIEEAGLETASDRNRPQQTAVYGITLNQTAQKRTELLETAENRSGLQGTSEISRKLQTIESDGRQDFPCGNQTQAATANTNEFLQNVSPSAKLTRAISNSDSRKTSGAVQTFATQLLRQKREYNNGYTTKNCDRSSGTTLLDG